MHCSFFGTKSVLILSIYVGFSAGQINIRSLVPAQNVFLAFHGMNGSVACRFTPPDASFADMTWYYSDINNFTVAKAVYDYSNPTGSGSSYEHLLGRASHSHVDGLATLHIYNTSLFPDAGYYFCEYRGSITLHNTTIYEVHETTYENCSNINPFYDKSLLEGSDVIIRVQAECNFPPVTFNFTFDFNKDDYYTNYTENTVSLGCTPPMMKSLMEYSVFSVGRNFNFTLTRFHPSFNGSQCSTVHQVEVIGTSTPSPTTQIHTAPTPGIRVFGCPGCIEKKDQTAVTVVAVLILLTGTCVIIMSACVCKISQDGEINKEHRSEPKHEVEPMKMTVDNNVASQVVEGSPNRTEEDELYESCITCCPCCTCCKWCLRRCSCCKWFPMKCKLCACTCTCRCPCKCPWCISRLFGITCGSFAIIIAVITLIVIQTRTVCQTYVINSTTTNTPC